MKLTDKTVEAAQCPEGAKDKLFFDETLPGFGLRVTASGSRTFIVQYNVGRTKRRMVLGVWGRELTATQARAQGRGAAGAGSGPARPGIGTKDSAGRDPGRRGRGEGRRRQRRLHGREAGFGVDGTPPGCPLPVLSRARARRASPRPQDLAARAGRPLRPHRCRAGVGRSEGFVPAGPANRLRSEARACWTWAVKRGALAVNPWEATPRPQAKETPRERVLTDAELGALYIAAGAETAPWGVLVRLLILTGQRRARLPACGGMNST